MNKNNPELQKNKKKKKAIRFVFFVVFILIIGGLGSIVTEHLLFPWMATHSWFGKLDFFKKALERTTIINKTEQVTVLENRSVAEYVGKASSSVVEIVARPKNSQKTFLEQVRTASGIIATADGLVVSFNNDFFNDSEADFVVFDQSGKSYPANLVVKDRFTNLVLLQIEGAQNLSTAEFIAAEDIRPGMKTVVIGCNGFNAEISLRYGILSEWAKQFPVSGSIASSEKLQGVLFLDSVGGNYSNFDENLTGGAVVDFNGNLIGILGEKNDNTGKKHFVIPINHIRYLIDQFLQKGRIERASLGLYYLSLSREFIFPLGDSVLNRGALVYSPSGQQGLAVLSGSAAEKSGLQISDIISQVNGEEINPDQNLAFLISKYRAGDVVSLKIIRSGKEMEVKAVLQ